MSMGSKQVSLYLSVLMCFVALATTSSASPQRYSTHDQSLEKAITALSQYVMAKLSNCNLGQCPRGWRKFRSSCYKADPTTKTWQEARKACLGLGADLVKITSKEENNFLYTIIHKDARARNYMWIGLKYSSKTKKHHWPDRTLPSFTNWYPGEPSSKEREPCGEMFVLVNGYVGTWNDAQCSSSGRGFICEKTAGIY